MANASETMMANPAPKACTMPIYFLLYSPNVLNAVDWANRHGLKTFGLTGFDGGKLRKMAHSGMHVPLDDMGMVESIHLCLFHWALNDVFARINHEGRYRR